METKICSCCGRELPVESFSTGKVHGTSFVHKICKDCMNQKKRDGHLRRKQEMDAKKECDLDAAKRQRLSDFSPRELMLELKRRGYEGELTFVEIHKINLNNLD